jgi:glycosyltransferase involved in cell wall biosynthesis
MWTVPNGVRIPARHLERRDRPSVIFCAAMHMAMNDEAASWLIREIVPRVRREIPDCDFVLVGGSPTLRVRRAARRAKVCFTGLVPDVEPYYRAATVAVVPVRMGGGTKIKTLEAMSYGLPLVSTSAGVQGIDIVPLVHAIVADDPDRFAAGIIRMARDRVASDRMGAAARDLVQQRYLWDDIYGAVRQRLAGVTPHAALTRQTAQPDRGMRASV